MSFLAVLNEQTGDWSYYANESYLPEDIKAANCAVHKVAIKNGYVEKDTAFPENVGKPFNIYIDAIQKIVPF